MRSVAAIAVFGLMMNLIGQVPLVRSQPTSIKLSPQFSPNPMALKGTGGGSTPVSELIGQSSSPTGPCTGFANATPDHTLMLGGFFKSLSIAIDSPQDTALVIRGPGGIWCNDDFQGKNPGVTGQWLAGKYEIWVSSYSKNRNVPYVLRLTGNP